MYILNEGILGKLTKYLRKASEQVAFSQGWEMLERSLMCQL